MIIDEKIKKQLKSLNIQIENISNSNSLTDMQIESFLLNFEKVRYNLLAEIKEYNKNIEFEHEKIKTIDDNYKTELKDNVLKIYVPETLPSFKNLKTHTYKRILLNVAEITKQYKGLFGDEVFIYIKVCDSIKGWDIDNKYVKPIADALILSGVIEDDNMSKMFYSAKGEFSEIPHTIIYVLDGKNMEQFLKKVEF